MGTTISIDRGPRRTTTTSMTRGALALVFVGALLLSRPGVAQTNARARGIGVRLVELVNRTISGRLDVGAVAFNLPGTVIIDDVTLKDPSGATVMRLARVEIVVRMRELLRRQLHVTQLTLDAPRFTLAPAGDSLNLLEALRGKGAKDDDEAATGHVVIEGILVRSAAVDYDDGKGTRASVRGVSGAATVDVDLATSVVRLQSRGIAVGSGTVHVDDEDIALGPASVAAFDLFGDDVTITGARAIVAGAAVTAAGTVDLAGDGRLALAGSVKAPAALKVPGAELPFALPAVDTSFAATGTFADPRVAADGSFGAFAPEDVRIDSGSFTLTASKTKVDVAELVASLGRGQVRAKGTFAIDSGAADLVVSGAQVQLSRLLARASRARGGQDLEPPHGVLGFAATIKGATKGAEPLAIAASLTGLVQGRVDGSVFVERKALDLGVDVRFAGLHDALPLGDDAFIGAGALRGRATGSFDDPRLAGVVSLDRATLQGVPIAALSSTFDAGKERVFVKDLRGLVAGGALSGHVDARLVAGGQVRGRVALARFDLATLSGPAAGSLGRGDLVIDLAGSGTRPEARLKLAATSVMVRDEAVGDVVARVKATKERVDVLEATITGPAARVTTAGLSLDLKSKEVAGRVVLEQLLLSRVQAMKEAKVSGRVAGDVVIAGTLDEPDVTAALEVVSLVARGGALGAGRVQAHLEGRVLDATARLVEKRSHIDVKLHADLAKELVDARAALTEVQLSPWLALAPDTIAPLTGVVSGVVTAKGKLAAPDVDVKLASPQIATRATASAKALVLGPLDVEARLQDRVLTASVCAFSVSAASLMDRGGDGPCARADRVWLQATGPLDIETGAFAIEVDAFVDLPDIELLVPAVAKSDTALGATTRVRGTLKKAADEEPIIDVLATLTALRVKREGAPLLVLARPVDVRFAEGIVSVPAVKDAPPLLIASEDKTVRFETAAIVSERDVDVDVDGVFPLVLLKAAAPAIANATGTARVDLRVTGDPRSALAVDGEVVPSTEASLTPRVSGQRITFLDGAVRFAPASAPGLVRVTFDDVRVELGGGEAVAKGSVVVRAAPMADHERVAASPRADASDAGVADDDDASSARVTGDDGAADLGVVGDEGEARDTEASFVTAWDLSVVGDGLFLRQGDTRADVAFELSLEGDAPDPLLSGSLQVVDGDILKTFAFQDFVLSADEPGDPRPLDEQLAPFGLSRLRLDVEITVRDFRARAELPAFSLDAFLRGDLRLADTIRAPRIVGAFGVETGEINFPQARFEITDMQLELPTGAPGAPTSPIIFLSAHADIPPRAAGNDTTLPIDLLLEGPIDAMALDLVATGGGQPYTRADLLSVVLFGKPLDDFGSGQSRGAVALVAGQASAALTRALSDRIEQSFGGQLELNLIAAEDDANDPRLAAGWRWRVGRRIDLEGAAGLGNATGTPSASTTTQAATDFARLRLLVFDHLPVGEELAFEGRIARSSVPGTTTSGELRLGFRWFEGRIGPSVFAFLFPDDALPPRRVPATPKRDVNAPTLARVDATVTGGAPATRDLDETRLRESLAGLLGRPLSAPAASDASSMEPALPAAQPYAIVAEAEQRLRALGLYRRIACHVVEPPEGGVLACDVEKARVVRDLAIEGLALGMLEADARRRLSVRSGDVVDALEGTPPANGSRLSRQEKSLEEYLEREGFHGADVQTFIKPDPEDPSIVDLVVRIEGGTFVSVRDVEVALGKDARDLDADDIANRFRAMCLRPDAIVDALFSGGIACYSRAKVRERTEDLERKLRDDGYPEARVRVVARFGVEDNVDLRVRVRRGPKLTTAIVVDRSGGDVVDLPGIFADQSSWTRRTLLEPLTRAFGGSLDNDVIVGDLEDHLTFAGARATDEAEAQVSATALLDHLEERGRPDAEVDVHHTYDDAGNVAVRFDVRPGPAVIVADVRVEGVDDELAKDIAADADLRSRARGVLRSGFLAEDDVDADAESLRQALVARGYAEAVVADRITTLPPQEDGTERMEVVFSVDEGRRFLVRSVEVHGDPELESDVLAALSSCQAAPGWKGRGKLTPERCVDGPLLVDELDADEDRVRALYAANGYPRTDVRLEQTFDREGVRLRVTVEGTDGALKQAVLGEVFLRGNTSTQGSVLRRELRLAAGDEGKPLDPLSIQKGVSRVRRTGLYSRVNLDYVGLDEVGVPVDVTVQVEEKPSFSVDSSVGFSTERLFTLGFEVEEHNTFGSMIELGAILEWGLFIGRASRLQLPNRWPRILGTDLTAAFTPFASYRDESSGVTLIVDDPVAGAGEALLGQGPRRRLFAAGAAFSLDYAINMFDFIELDALTVGIAYELRSEWTNLDAEPYPLFSPESFRTVSGLTDVFDVAPARIAALTPRIFYSDIDNPFDPLEGISAELLFKASSPWWLSQDWFGVLGASATATTTFVDRFTIASRVALRWGFAGAQECNDCEWALMQNDLFLLGGERSVRGYGENTIGVRGPLFTPALEPIGVIGPRQGLFGAQASLELRMLLWKNLGFGDLKPALFVDTGVVTDDVRGVIRFDERIRARELGLSVGAGIRYVMPVGPALFDCAISPIQQTPSGAPIAGCHLALGYTF